jgi:hypothetical protein
VRLRRELSQLLQDFLGFVWMRPSKFRSSAEIRTVVLLYMRLMEYRPSAHRSGNAEGLSELACALRTRDTLVTAEHTKHAEDAMDGRFAVSAQSIRISKPAEKFAARDCLSQYIVLSVDGKALTENL